ncbi:MAG: SUMF1/EgtB/PvdO family nonheme iron enzyme [Deferribacteraceae bacterium]|nr:SUMF1/EgtB/PvdO family nonheme iron enzyme [Deferribacteraceae bacterium]
MRTVFSFVVLAMLFAIFGCGGKSAEAPKAPVNQCLVGAPDWVVSGGGEAGSFSASGSAKISAAGMSFARTAALGNARDEMARGLSVKVNNMLKDFTQVTGIGDAAVVDKVTSSVSRQVASQTLQGTAQKATWTSPCNDLWVLAVIDATAVQAAVKQSVNSSYKNENALWQQFQSQKAQGELSAAITKEFSQTALPVAPPAAVAVPAAPPPPALAPLVVTPAPQPTVTIPQSVIPDNMVWVEGGAFMMGSPSSEIGRGRYSIEGPQHKVTVSGFYMSKYEITRAEYEELMGSNPLYFQKGWSHDEAEIIYERHIGKKVAGSFPVTYVSWFDAIEYCNKRSIKEGLTPVYTIDGFNVKWNRGANGYRLPTEAEWEYAAKGGNKDKKTFLYSGSNNLDEVAWHSGNAITTIANPVGLKAPNSLGLYDMSGNVAEWCWDWMDYDYYKVSPDTNPVGPDTGSGTYDSRVLRGGQVTEGISWKTVSEYNKLFKTTDKDLWDQFRSSSRSSLYPGQQNNRAVGFRVVRN